jgi:hypothetical protein
MPKPSFPWHDRQTSLRERRCGGDGKAHQTGEEQRARRTAAAQDVPKARQELVVHV